LRKPAFNLLDHRRSIFGGDPLRKTPILTLDFAGEIINSRRSHNQERQILVFHQGLRMGDGCGSDPMMLSEWRLAFQRGRVCASSETEIDCIP
jgi:hypothetical protein